ncbi:peptidoglycan DD-metalloendopeptidase family protein [Clostridium sartagoforme]|nr:peptidoglycan DD-metalloendopeptidase family protein [Clostridium sartagoforme]
MNINEDYKSHIKLAKLIALSLVMIIITLNYNSVKANAAVNEKLNINNTNISFLENKTDENILDNLLVALTGKVFGYEVILNDDLIGYTFIEDSLDNIEESLLNIYLREKGIKREDVLSYKVDMKLDLKKNRFDVELLQTSDEVAKALYDIAKKDKDEINITVKYIKEEKIEIKPSTVIIQSDNLYLGESKVEEGTKGLSKVTKEITIDIDEEIENKVINKSILIKEVSKIIYKGTKNPYEYGVAFLNHPTGGGYMTSGYGERWNSFHKGIDIAGDTGDDVIAAMDGEVIYSEYNDGGYGNLIIVKHEDDMETYYGHLNESYVKVGDKIKKGDIIGAVGNTGFSTGPHLHFELRIDDEPVDPTDYIVKKVNGAA